MGGLKRLIDRSLSTITRLGNSFYMLNGVKRRSEWNMQTFITFVNILSWVSMYNQNSSQISLLDLQRTPPLAVDDKIATCNTTRISEIP